MTVAALIAELEKLPPEYEVYAAGERADKVIVEKCKGNIYVRIFEPWEVSFISGEDLIRNVKV